MNLEIVRTANSPYLFRSANPLRDWMDETFSNHAYRCVPLVNANSYGWEIVLPSTVVAKKNKKKSGSKLITLSKSITKDQEDSKVTKKEAELQQTIEILKQRLQDKENLIQDLKNSKNRPKTIERSKAKNGKKSIIIILAFMLFIFNTSRLL